MAKIVKSFHNISRISRTILLQKFYNNDLSDTIFQRRMKKQYNMCKRQHIKVRQIQRNINGEIYVRVSVVSCLNFGNYCRRELAGFITRFVAIF